MPLTRREEETLERFRSRIAATAALGDDIRITRRISGGAPGTRLVRETVLNGAGRTQVRHLDELSPVAGEKKAELTIDERSAREVLQALADHFGELIPRAEARFVPDSLVGSVTIEVGGESVTMFYDAGAEEEAEKATIAARPLYSALMRVRQLEVTALPELGGTAPGPSRAPER